MLKHIDWQLITFVTVTTLHDYWVFIRLPEFYYWEATSSSPPNNKKAS